MGPTQEARAVPAGRAGRPKGGPGHPLPLLRAGEKRPVMPPCRGSRADQARHGDGRGPGRAVSHCWERLAAGSQRLHDLDR